MLFPTAALRPSKITRPSEVFRFPVVERADLQMHAPSLSCQNANAQLELNNDPRPRMVASSGVAAWEEGASAANGTLLRQEQNLAHTKIESRYTLQQTTEGNINSGNVFFYQLMT